MLSLLFVYTVLLCCASLGKKYFLYISKMEKIAVFTMITILNELMLMNLI